MTATPLPLALAVAGAVVYHIAQKSVPDRASLFVVVGLAYAVGAAVCAGVVVWGGADVAGGVRVAWRQAAGIGLGALGVEAGYLLAYRAGWPISTASLGVNAAVAAVLVAIGLLAFGEVLTVRQWAGVAACAVGLVLLTSR
ncbi:hypothetical protein RQM47_08095 [Rubrivirga sp. S365]|uniref:EamA-like transporter family protein n=1 Tax=Rubrivirga litoralis TaxID=3075598 RepID=A0ABU3BNU8_9BACT|nr:MULTISPECIES: hypothetical protein [unclassified Rubrivirga]MDT0630955.1 hypothetical protein [Rubrivirga sp. F394]MDT7856598.1 hypothetical protein [Rubrivirga sp. S365]